MFIFKETKMVKSTPFSEFIRNASSAEKKRVYDSVIKKSTERQRQVLAAAASC